MSCIALLRASMRGMVAISFLGLAACVTPIRPAATSLSEAGVTTSRLIGAYYGALDETARQQFEQEALAQALSDITSACVSQTKPLPVTSEECRLAVDPSKARIRRTAGAQVELYVKILAATKARQRLVVEMEGMYADLGALAKEDLGAAFAGKRETLQAAIDGVRSTPIPAAQGEVLGKILGEIGEAIQNGKIREGETGIQPLTEKVHAYFRAERPAWETLGDQLVQLRHQNVVYAVQLGFAGVGDAPERLLAVLGVTRGELSLRDNPATFEALVVSRSLGAASAEQAIKRAGASAENALGALVAAHNAFDTAASGPSYVTSFVAEARAYLDLAVKLRNERDVDPKTTEAKEP